MERGEFWVYVVANATTVANPTFTEGKLPQNPLPPARPYCRRPLSTLGDPCPKTLCFLGRIGFQAKNGATWANLSQLGPTWDQLGANLGQHGPTWANMGQHGANMELTWGSLGTNWKRRWGKLEPTWANVWAT